MREGCLFFNASVFRSVIDVCDPIMCVYFFGKSGILNFFPLVLLKSVTIFRIF